MNPENNKKSIRIRVAVILMQGSKILLIRHQKGDSTYWLIPGGGVDFGETIQECALREIKEETNLDIKIKKLVLINESIAPDGTRHILNLFFLGEILGGSIKVGEEERLKELKFVDLEELENLELHPPVASYIKEAYKKEFSGELMFAGNLWL